MKRINQKLLVLIPAVLLLAACHQQSGSTTGAQSAANLGASASAASATNNVVQSRKTAVISVDPSSMAACDPAATAVVKWDVSGRPGVTGVKVYVGSGADEKLFAAGGATGSATTGLWTRPGTTFTVKNVADGAVLGSVTVQGPVCK